MSNESILYDIGFKDGYQQALKELNANQFERVVRCKDCKYYDHFNGCMSWHDVNSNNDNWFCADGERGDSKE